MNINLIAAGKIKEKYFTEAVAEYAKRLQRYCRLTILQVQDEPAPEKASPAERDAILGKEGDRILRNIRSGDYVIALAIEGTSFSSEDLAEHLGKLTAAGNSTIDFVIGGSLGLSRGVMERADEAISFSRMTFPHQLMRVILLEQIYRSFRILNHEPYHK